MIDIGGIDSTPFVLALPEHNIGFSVMPVTGDHHNEIDFACRQVDVCLRVEVIRHAVDRWTAEEGGTQLLQDQGYGHRSLRISFEAQYPAATVAVFAPDQLTGSVETCPAQLTDMRLPQRIQRNPAGQPAGRALEFNADTKQALFDEVFEHHARREISLRIPRLNEQTPVVGEASIWVPRITLANRLQGGAHRESCRRS